MEDFIESQILSIHSLLQFDICDWTELECWHFLFLYVWIQINSFAMENISFGFFSLIESP